MSDDHPQRIAVLETKLEHLDERTQRIETAQTTHGESLDRIEKHLASQSGATRMGLWVLGGIGTLAGLLIAVFKDSIG